MTKREEAIEQLTKGMSPRDRQALIDFWNGKGTITGDLFKKYKSQIAEFERIMSTDNKLEEFMKETRGQYKTAPRLKS